MTYFINRTLIPLAWFAIALVSQPNTYQRYGRLQKILDLQSLAVTIQDAEELLFRVVLWVKRSLASPSPFRIGSAITSQSMPATREVYPWININSSP